MISFLRSTNFTVNAYRKFYSLMRTRAKKFCAEGSYSFQISAPTSLYLARIRGTGCSELLSLDLLYYVRKYGMEFIEKIN